MRPTAALAALALAAAPAALAQPGAVDASFGGGPVAVTTGVWGPNSSGGGFGTLNRAVVQSSGKTVVLGRCNLPAAGGMGAVRFNTDGTIDSSFGQGGTFEQPYLNGQTYIAPFQYPGLGVGHAALGPGDRIVMVDDRFQFVCITANGALDATFGSGGRLSLYNTAKRYWYTGSLAFQTDGKLVVAGYSIPQNGNGNYDLTIARLNANGTLDSTFASFGRGSTPGYLIDAQAGNQVAARGTLAIQTDGRILAAANSSDSAPFVARYLGTGAVDTSFGAGGKLHYSFAGVTGPAKGMALTGDGRIVLAAQSGQTMYIARYSAAGGLDPTFGGSGTGWIGIVLPGNAAAGYGIALQADGSVLLPVIWPDGGENPALGATTDAAVLRLTPAGVPDTSFGLSGSGLSELGGWADTSEGARALAIDHSGRIILAGSHYDGTVGGIFTVAVQP